MAYREDFQNLTPRTGLLFLWQDPWCWQIQFFKYCCSIINMHLGIVSQQQAEQHSLQGWEIKVGSVCCIFQVCWLLTDPIFQIWWLHYEHTLWSMWCPTDLGQTLPVSHQTGNQGWKIKLGTVCCIILPGSDWQLQGSTIAIITPMRQASTSGQVQAQDKTPDNGTKMFKLRIKTLSEWDLHWRNLRKKTIESSAI